MGFIMGVGPWSQSEEANFWLSDKFHSMLKFLLHIYHHFGTKHQQKTIIFLEIRKKISTDLLILLVSYHIQSLDFFGFVDIK